MDVVSVGPLRRKEHGDVGGVATCVRQSPAAAALVGGPMARQDEGLNFRHVWVGEKGRPVLCTDRGTEYPALRLSRRDMLCQLRIPKFPTPGAET